MLLTAWLAGVVALCQHVHPTEPPKKVAVDTSGGITLAELERLALERKPRLGVVKAKVDAAAGRVTQAGLWPNPSVGATGEHVSTVTNGGAIGGFVEQRIVTG